MDEAPRARRPTRLALAGVLLFVVAVFLARLLIEGGAAWVLFGALILVVLFAVTARAGFGVALAVTAGFTLLVLGLRWVLEWSPTGWIVLLLLPVLVFTAVLVGRVLAQMRRDRRAAREARDNAEAEG